MAGKIPIVGIDLGTTNCAVAYVGPGDRIVSIVNFQGDVLTPTAIVLQGDSVIIGREAFRTGPAKPEFFAEMFKRHMGEPDFLQPVDDKLLQPEVLSAIVLRQLRNDVVRTLGGAERAIITVPAYFDEGRRRATQNAGQIAGWDVADIINEPTAAALAYAHHAGRLGASAARERVLVYDLGGGTFDATILEIHAGKEYLALATEGDVRLGGHDWDEQLRTHLAEQFTAKTGINPLETPRGKAEFLKLAQQAKHKLSNAERAVLPASYMEKRVSLEVTRKTFESLTAALLERTRSTTEELLDQAKLAWSDLDRILVVGGSTRMPMVGRMLEEASGKPVDRTLSPEEAVSQGAAVYARLKTQANAPRVINVNSHSLRVIGRNAANQRITAMMIPKNTPLPAEATKFVPVMKAGLTFVDVPVCEGEADDPEYCELVGKVRVSGIPSDGRRWIVGVELLYREDGCVDVAATIRDPDNTAKITGEVSATLIPQRGMTPEQIAEAIDFLNSLSFE